MSSKKQIQVNMSFNADTASAKRSLDELQRQLSTLINQPVPIGEKMTSEIQQATRAAAELKVHLQNATNVKTGNLDLSKLHRSLQQSKFELADYGAQLQKMGPQGQKAFMQLANSIARAEIPMKRTSALMKEIKQTFANTIQWQLSSSAIHGVMGAIQGAYSYSQKLNESLNNIRIVTNKSVEDMSRFAAEANKAAKALSASTIDYTDASLIYYQQGLTDEQVRQRTDVTIKMANVSRQSAEIVSDQMTAIWNNFYDGSKSLEYYADVVTALGAATASSSEEISQGLEKFAAVAETVGLSYEYATAALATVTSTTRQSADVVGTAFKTLFARIQDLNLGKTLDDGTTLGKYSEALNKVGISIKDANGDLKDMDTVLEEMGAKWKTLSKDNQVALAKSVAGIRQYTQLIALMDNWDFMQKNLSTAETAAGTLTDQAEIYAESWEAAQKRVKASAEKLYSTLINDEFFIDLTDTFADLINLVGQFTQSIGGLQGVLMGAGMILTKIYGKEMAQSFRDLAFRITSTSETGRKATMAWRVELLNSLKEQFVNTDYLTKAQIQNQEVYKHELEMQATMLEMSEQLTEEEKQQNLLLLEQYRLMGQTSVALADNVEKLNDRHYNLRTSIENRNKVKGNASAQSNLENVMSSSQLAGTLKAQLDSFSNAVKSNQNIDEYIDEITQSLKLLGKSDNEIEKIIGKLSNMSTNAQDAAEQIKAINNEAQKKISENVKNFMGSVKYSDKDASKREQMQREIQELVDVQQKLTISEYQLDNVNKNLSKSTDEFQQKLRESKVKIQDWAGNLTGAIQGITSFGMALSSIKGLMDTIKDPDTSNWEKFAMILTSISMIASSISGTITGMKDAWKLIKDITNKQTIEQLKKIATEIIEEKVLKKTAQAQREKNQAVDQGTKETREYNNEQTKKVVLDGIDGTQDNPGQGKLPKGKMPKIDGKAFGKAFAGKGGGGLGLLKGGGMSAGMSSLGSFIAGVAAIASAVAIVAGAITLAVVEYNKFEKAAERAQESAKAAAESYNEIKTKYDEFKSSVSDYKDITDSMKDMTKGTVEYREAILKANEAAMKLIENYKGLKYEINNEGVIQIDEQSLEDIQQQKLNQLGRAQAGSISASMQANRRQAAMDRKELARDIDTEQDNWTNIGNAAAMAGAGAIAGLLIGGWPGAIIGGLAGAVGGGIAVGITGSGTKAEDDALLAIAEYYRENGNSMFADDKEFERVLREEIKVSENLIDGLVNNRKAIEELTKVEAARLGKESADWKNAFNAYNTGTEAYDNAENKAYLENVAEKDRVKYEEDANEYIDSLMDGWNDPKLFEEYIKKVLGDENLEHYAVKDRLGANATLWKDGQKVTNVDALNKEDVKAQLKELYIMEQVSKEIGVNVETYKDQLEDLSDIIVDIEDEKSRALVDDIIAQYANGKGGPIDLSKYNYDEVMQIAVDNIADAGMRASVEKAKDNYINGMSDLHKKIIKESWYKELSQEQRSLLWGIEFNEHDTMDRVKRAYELAQGFFDQNKLQASLDIGFGLKDMIQVENKNADQWKALSTKYEDWRKEQGDPSKTLEWGQFLKLTQSEQLNYIESFVSSQAYQNVLTAQSNAQMAENDFDATKSENEYVSDELTNRYNKAKRSRYYRTKRNAVYETDHLGSLAKVGGNLGAYKTNNVNIDNDLATFKEDLGFEVLNFTGNPNVAMKGGTGSGNYEGFIAAFEEAFQNGLISADAVLAVRSALEKASNGAISGDYAGEISKLLGALGYNGTQYSVIVDRLSAGLQQNYFKGSSTEGQLASNILSQLLYNIYQKEIGAGAAEEDAVEAGAESAYNNWFGAGGALETSTTKITTNRQDANMKLHNARDSWEKWISQYGVNTSELNSVSQDLQLFNKYLAQNDDLSNWVAAGMIRYKKAIDAVSNSYDKWIEILNSGSLTEKIELLNQLQETIGHLLNTDGNQFSKDFLLSSDTLKLLKMAAQGDDEAFNTLQALAAKDLIGYSETYGNNILDLYNNIASDTSFELGQSVANDSDIYTQLNDIYQDALKTAESKGLSSTEEQQTFADSILSILGYSITSNGIDANGNLNLGFAKTGSELTYLTQLLNDELDKIEHKTLDEVLERYYEINNQLDDMTDAMDDANRELDKMYGKTRIGQMEKVNNLLTKEIGLLEEKADWNVKYAELDRTNLDNQLKLRDFELKDSDGNIIDGFAYDDNGNITNFTQVMDAIINQSDTVYKDLNEKTSAESRADYEKKILQPFTEWMEKVIEYAKTYKETIEEGEDIENEIADAWSEWQTRNSEILNLKLELKISINDRELEYIENKINNMSDDFYQMAEVAGLLVDKGEILNNNMLENAYVELEHARKAVNEKGDAWLTDADYYASMEELLSQVYSNIDAIKQLDDTMMSYYGDTLAAAGEELAKFTSQMEHQSAVLDHYKSIMTAIGKEVDYKRMGVILKGQSELLGDQYGIAKQNYEMLAGETQEKYNAWQKALEDHKDAEAELYKAEYEAALQASNEAQNKYLELANKWAEALKAELENALADLDKTLEEALTGGTTFDRLNTTMERTRSLQEEYLTTTNKVYETNKLMRQAQQEIDKISNTSAKRRLQAYIQETQQLQGQSKLSQYELEIQQAKYDLLLAEIALEEAQNAKSTVRLQRDSEGNFGYVYTADQNAIDDASQNLADAQNSLYNLGLQGANEYTEKIIQLNSEMYDKLVELHKAKADGEFKTEAEYQEAVTELQNYWNEQRMNYSNLYSAALTTDSAVVADAWSTDVQYMIDASADWSTKVNDYVAGVTGAFADWEEKVATIANDTTGTDLGTLATKVEEVTDKSKDLVDILSGVDGKDGLLKLMQTELDEVTKKTDAYAKLRDELQKTAEAYNRLAGEMKDELGEANGDNANDATWYTYTDENGKESGHYSSAEEAAKAAWEAKHLKGTMSAEDVNNLVINSYLAKDGKETMTDSSTVGDYNTGWQVRPNINTGTGENVEDPGLDVLPDNGGTNAPPEPGTPESPGSSSTATLLRYTVYATKHFGILSSSCYSRPEIAARNALDPNDEVGEIKCFSVVLWYKGIWRGLGPAKKYLDTPVASSPTIGNPSITPPGDIGILPIQPPGIIPFASGGYTGAWGSYGKLAMLHEKELVLNKQQTQDLLLSMEVLERILQTIDLQSVNSQIGGILSSPGFSNPGNGILEQNVHIEASFPHATNHSEIEEAFGNLVNLASQYANRK